MKLKKQIDPNIEEAEIVIVARRQEEFSAIVKEYHLEDLSSIDNENSIWQQIKVLRLLISEKFYI